MNLGSPHKHDYYGMAEKNFEAQPSAASALGNGAGGSVSAKTAVNTATAPGPANTITSAPATEHTTESTSSAPTEPPPSDPTMTTTAPPPPLDSPLRTTPLHPDLPGIKVPSESTAQNLNPVTLRPFTLDELKDLGFEALVEKYVGGASGLNDGGNKEEARSERDDLARQLREKLEENERKRAEIEREMDEKEKIRDVERRVFEGMKRKQGERAGS